MSFFILLMHALLFGYFFLEPTGFKWILLAACIINVFSLSLFFFPHAIKDKTKYALSIALVINAIVWFVLGNILMGLLIIILIIMNYYSSKKPVVIFFDDYILYPSFPARKLYWKDVQDVIIKDDILTIDLKSNALIQQKIENHHIGAIDIMAFNVFIRTKLGAS